jgi:hypothetical protein
MSFSAGVDIPDSWLGKSELDKKTLKYCISPSNPGRLLGKFGLRVKESKAPGNRKPFGEY